MCLVDKRKTKTLRGGTSTIVSSVNSDKKLKSIIGVNISGSSEKKVEKSKKVVYSQLPPPKD